MKDTGRLLWLTTGLLLGAIGAAMYLHPGKTAQAANDRFEDFVMCTGTVAVTPRAHTDGVWLLDYRTGRLLGTVIDRTLGKIVGWAELDLVTEFQTAPRQNVHFVMTTGSITFGQAALYLAETTSGKMGIYTLASRPDGLPGLIIRRHDMTSFREPREPAVPVPPGT